MRKFHFAAFVGATTLLLTTLVAALAQMPMSAQNFVQGASGGGGSFTGVGDTLSGAKAHWGSIAYSAASRGHKMYNLCNVSDVACADVSSDATTGLVSSTQVIGGVTCGTTGGTNLCTVKIAYDDSGANACTSAACDVSNSTIASRPTFLPSASGSIPAIKCPGAAQLITTTNLTSLSQPLSSLAGMNTTVSGLQTAVAAGSGIQFGFDTGFKVFYYATGGILDSVATTSSGTFIAGIGTQQSSGSSGSAVLNNSATTGTVGTSSGGSSLSLCASGANSNPMTGQILEGAVYNLDITSSDSALTTTMKANGGY